MPLPWKAQDRKVYRDWIHDIISEASDRLSDWESNFIESLQAQMERRDLSEKQATILENIYTKYTS